MSQIMFIFLNVLIVNFMRDNGYIFFCIIRFENLEIQVEIIFFVNLIRINILKMFAV